jgi:hypothetical protein
MFLLKILSITTTLALILSFHHVLLTNRKTRGRFEIPALFVSQLVLQSEEKDAVIRGPNRTSVLIDFKPD